MNWSQGLRRTELRTNGGKEAGLTNKKKPSVTYVVAKKGAGKKVRRPAGVKGQFKVSMILKNYSILYMIFT